jgi:hypothetical protein
MWLSGSTREKVNSLRPGRGVRGRGRGFFLSPSLARCTEQFRNQQRYEKCIYMLPVHKMFINGTIVSHDFSFKLTRNITYKSWKGTLLIQKQSHLQWGLITKVSQSFQINCSSVVWWKVIMRDHNGITASNISQVQPPILRERGLLGGRNFHSKQNWTECMVTTIQSPIKSFLGSPKEIYGLHLWPPFLALVSYLLCWCPLLTSESHLRCWRPFLTSGSDLRFWSLSKKCSYFRLWTPFLTSVSACNHAVRCVAKNVNLSLLRGQ